MTGVAGGVITYEGQLRSEVISVITDTDIVHSRVRQFTADLFTTDIAGIDRH